MAVTTSISIRNLETVNLDGFQKFVVAVQYTITGTEGDKTYSLDITNNLGGYDPENPSATDTSSLIPYENLTEQMVLDWIVAQPAHESYVKSVEQNEVFVSSDVENEIGALPW